MAISYNDPPINGNALTDTQKDVIRTALRLGIDLEVADPTVTGVDYPLGSIGYTNEVESRVFIKTGSLLTDWSLIGSTSGFANIDLSNVTPESLLQAIVLRDYSETVVTTAASGATHTINFTAGNVHDITLSDNCVFSITNPPSAGKAGSLTIYLRQDATGNRVSTWPAELQTTTTLTSVPSSYDIITILTIDGGTTYQMMKGLTIEP